MARVVWKETSVCMLLSTLHMIASLSCLDIEHLSRHDMEYIPQCIFTEVWSKLLTLFYFLCISSFSVVSGSSLELWRHILACMWLFASFANHGRNGYLVVLW